MSGKDSKNTSNANSKSAADETFEAVLVGLAKATGYLLWWAVLFPAISIPFVIALVVAFKYGVNAGFLTLVGLGCAYGLWAFLDEDSFEAWVMQPVRRRFLTWWRYTRTWNHVCALHGLTATRGERELTPALRSVRIGEHTDVLEVSVVTGQSIINWQKQTAALAAAFKADRLTITATSPGEIRITVMRGDVLAEPVALPRPAQGATVNLSALTIGVTEHGTLWRVPILGHHHLVAGSTGSGKGSVLQALISAMAPDVKSGRVRLCVIDPKGGMELGAGEPMFSFFSHDATGQTVELLRELVNLMHERANRLRGHTRLHTPTTADPLFVVIIDEIAALTAYVTDRKVKAEIEHLLGLLLSQGRAVGISVVGAIQDPSKDALPLRQLFTVRIGLRMTESSQTTMILGQAARDAGAECELIPDATPGVGYVMIDGTATPQRVRAFWVTDTDIAYLVRMFPAPRPRKHTDGGKEGR
ncbi:cell division protein FtsK [Mycobacteroides abscessus subsp. abscessus]|uniref:FtsK/SpoIIIE domain-containing protein n=1 Tax=Mycobacteroides abscessus TaxID=36809 RepID=UPI000928E6AA|nr:FtsK/SpoIIIE domain-containing protein [Mycobacteroides abscessus]SIJ23197.1 cell division protein FtsK [Mycobacteroides abscessus subsp. abscessus]SIJ29105.1 cell division protein FtsK [Mycobacteroides abscessus subsp. abscessus]SIJ35594.1 cell division protein FtsK [Mycobacteroides abscessus subsp. abscessus]